MKALVVYDTFSANRNTEKIAKVISEEFEKRGIKSEALQVQDVSPEPTGDYDCLVVGGPTHMRRATKEITRFLDTLSRKNSSGKVAAAFDTRMEKRFAGGANGEIEKKLKKLGFKMVIMPAAFIVERSGEVKDARRSHDLLRNGEVEKAVKFADEIADKLR